MKTISFLLTILISFSLNPTVFGDSPITSTPFSKAYQNEQIIGKASKTKGKLTNKLMIYLTDENNPIDVKMALINELGWNFKGKTNSIKFLKYLIKKKRYSTEDDFFKKGSSDELLCMGYLKAMDNYFEVDDAILYVESAVSKNPKSYTYQIITALIKAQKASGIDSCKVYKSTDEVRRNTFLEKDIKEGAITVIFEYMDIYKDSCNILP